MQQYEIRVVRRSGAPLIYNVGLVNDFAAIRKGQMLIDEGEYVEVWREMTCIYDSRKNEKLAG